MVRSAMGLDSEGVRTELDRAAERIGVEATIRDVALPAMHEIGNRWKTGAFGGGLARGFDHPGDRPNRSDGSGRLQLPRVRLGER